MTELEKRNLCKQLGTKVRLARKKAGITQIEFAKLLSLSRPSVVNIENGRQLPPLYVFYDIAKLLKIHIFDLIVDLSADEVSSNLEESSQKLIDKWKDSDPEDYSDDTINAVEEFIKDTNHQVNE